MRIGWTGSKKTESTQIITYAIVTLSFLVPALVISWQSKSSTLFRCWQLLQPTKKVMSPKQCLFTRDYNFDMCTFLRQGLNMSRFKGKLILPLLTDDIWGEVGCGKELSKPLRQSYITCLRLIVFWNKIVFHIFVTNLLSRDFWTTKTQQTLEYFILRRFLGIAMQWMPKHMTFKVNSIYYYSGINWTRPKKT